MHFRLSLFSTLLAFCCLSSLAHALAVEYDTATADTSIDPRFNNAERLRRGLPPLRPKSLYTPSKAGRALAPRVSNAVTTANHAQVVYASDPSTVIGYLAIATSASGYLAVVTDQSGADLYYAPSTVPASNTYLYTYSYNYGGNYYVHANSGSVTARFSGSGQSSDMSAVWTFSAVYSSNEVDITYAPSGSTPYNLYLLSGQSNRVAGGASAADVNTAFGTSITEADKILVTLVTS